MCPWHKQRQRLWTENIYYSNCPNSSSDLHSLSLKLMGRKNNYFPLFCCESWRLQTVKNWGHNCTLAGEYTEIKQVRYYTISISSVSYWHYLHCGCVCVCVHFSRCVYICTCTHYQCKWLTVSCWRKVIRPTFPLLPSLSLSVFIIFLSNLSSSLHSPPLLLCRHDSHVVLSIISDDNAE